MKQLLLMIAVVALVGCGKKKVAAGDLNGELVELGMQWDADIKLLKVNLRMTIGFNS